MKMATPRALTPQPPLPPPASSSHSLLGSLQQQQEKVLVQIREQQSRSRKEGGDLRWEGEHGGEPAGVKVHVSNSPGPGCTSCLFVYSACVLGACTAWLPSWAAERSLDLGLRSPSEFAVTISPLPTQTWETMPKGDIERRGQRGSEGGTCCS